MMISTKGRYALRVMLDLAEHKADGFVPLKLVAERQGLSLKYIEQIIPSLKKNNMIEGVSGKGGGYRLIKNPEEYTVGEILRLTEGSIAPVSCLECGAKPCERAKICKTLPVWKSFYKMTNDFFDGITLADFFNS